MGEPIFHICRREEWQAALAAGVYDGSSQDRADGFIHFSGAGQIAGSAARHRAGQDDLVLIAVDPASLGPALRWEKSRHGEAFPHLYAPLPVDRVLSARPLSLGADGRHVFPPLDLTLDRPPVAPPASAPVAPLVAPLGSGVSGVSGVSC